MIKIPITFLQGLSEKISNLGAIIRVMPNTPALVGAGCAGIEQKNQISNFVLKFFYISVFSVNGQAKPEHSEVTKKIFESVGICHPVPESLLDAFTGLSGSGPAYVSNNFICQEVYLIFNVYRCTWQLKPCLMVQ
jgi:pyrroline-5-carboxylate reductase